MFYKMTTIFGLLMLIFLTACTTAQQKKAENSPHPVPNLTKAALINTQIGLGYLKQGDVTLAKEKLILAQQQAPHLPEVLMAMAYFSENTGEPEKASVYYLRAIRENPKLGDAHNNYGAYLCRRGHYQQAIQEFLLAVADPNYLTTANAYENAGLCALLIPDKVLAKQYFTKAHESDPYKTSVLSELDKLATQTNNNLKK